MSAQEPRLDLTKIAFPTDRLTIKNLRERFPDGFDRVDHRADYFNGGDLEATLKMERNYALQAFDVATGEPPRDNLGYDMEEAREELAKALVQYGLATGPHHAEQLIRDIESQAAAQAKGFGPPPRP